jgi:hypothetical protein
MAIWSVPSMTGLEVWEEEPGLWRNCRCSRSLLAELRREEACCAAVVYRGTVHADVGGGPPSPLLCRDCAAIPCIACTAASMRGNGAMECKKQTQTTRPFVREREKRELRWYRLRVRVLLFSLEISSDSHQHTQWMKFPTTGWNVSDQWMNLPTSDFEVFN